MTRDDEGTARLEEGEFSNVEVVSDPHGDGVWLFNRTSGEFGWTKQLTYGAECGCIYFKELTSERLNLLAQLLRKQKDSRKAALARQAAKHMPSAIRRGTRKSTPDYTVEDHGFTTPCWVWCRALTRRGTAGRARFAGIRKYAHVGYYEQEYGPVPEGHVVTHLCSTRACVNPEHLEVITTRTVVQRGGTTKLTPDKVREIRMRRKAGETASALAHEFMVKPKAIERLISGRSWSYVTP